MSVETVEAPVSTEAPVPAGLGLPTTPEASDARPEPPHPLETRQQAEADVEATKPVNIGKRHRVSDIATPKDVGTIRALAALVKDLKGDAPRVRELRNQLREALKSDDEPAVAKAAQAVRTEEAKPRTVALPEPVGDFAEPRPTIEQFANSDDPYRDYVKADLRWEDRREKHESAKTDAQKQFESFIREEQADVQRLAMSFSEKAEAFRKTTADYDALCQSTSTPVTDLLKRVVLETGPEAQYFLLKNPLVVDELNLLTDGKPMSPQAVASTQRILHARMSAGSTGAAPSRPIAIPPRPPSPVRTTAMSAPASAPSDDDDLDAHARHFGVGSRRRR